MARAGRLTPRRLATRSVAQDGEHVRRMAPFFAEFDAVLTAVTATPPLPVGRFEGRGAFATYNGVARFVPFPGVWNMTGQPACSVPAGFSAGGVPLAAQLVARPDDEATLFSLAAQLEAERQWTARRPPSS
jgi:amidase